MPKICDRRLDSMVHFLADHRKHSEISLAEHSARRVADLSRMVLARRRVYLDTRYWIFLRDAALERPRKPIHQEMLDALLERVGSEILARSADAFHIRVPPTIQDPLGSVKPLFVAVAVRANVRATLASRDKA